MKKNFLYFTIFVFVAGMGWSLDLEVSKSGPITTIQEAIDQIGEEGGTITITESGVYEETFWMGDDMERSGQPIHITSPFSGDERPVISPLAALGPFVEAQRDDRRAGTAIFIDGEFVIKCDSGRESGRRRTDWQWKLRTIPKCG